MKYNIMIPIANPNAAQTSNPQKYMYRMCNVYQTDNADHLIKELAGYLLDFFPARVELKGTSDEEDRTFMEKMRVMKEEVTRKMNTNMAEEIVGTQQT